MEYDTIKLLNLEDADKDLSKSSVIKSDDNTLNGKKNHISESNPLIRFSLL